IDVGSSFVDVQHVEAIMAADAVIIAVTPRSGSVNVAAQYVRDLMNLMSRRGATSSKAVAVVLNGVGDGTVSERKLLPLFNDVDMWGAIPFTPREIDRALDGGSLPILAEEPTAFTMALSGIVHSHIAPLPREAAHRSGRFGLFRKNAS
ncbi:MAG: P-loop NTPase family protein, partial [Chloroflexota bacterium]